MQDILKKRKAVLISLLYILLIVFFSSIILAADYNLNDGSTWYSSRDNFEKLKSDLAGDNINKVNDALSKLSESQRAYVFEQVRKMLRETDPKNAPNIEKLTGFGNSKLKFLKSEKGNLIIGDGEKYINLLKGFPKDVKYLQYLEKDSEGKSKFVLYFKDGGELTLGYGATDKNGDLRVPGIEKPLTLDSLKAVLKTNQKVEIGLDGIHLSNGAEVELFWAKLSQVSLDKTASIKILGDSKLQTQSTKIISKEGVVIKTPDNLFTNVFLKEGDYSEALQTVQVDKNLIRVNGKDISIQLTKPSSIKDERGNLVPYDIHVNGRNLNLENGAFSFRFDGKNSFVSRLNDLKKDFYLSTIKNEQSGEYVLPIVPVPESDKTAIKPEPEPFPSEKAKPTTTPTELPPKPGTVSVVDEKTKDSKVCIGKFCEIRGLFGREIPNPIKPYDYSLGTTEMLIFKSEIYGSETEISKLLQGAPEGLSKAGFAKYVASQNPANVESISQVETTWIDKKQIDKNINEMLAPLGLPQSELDRVEQFKLTQVYPNLAKNRWGTPTYVPKGSVVTIMSTDKGEVYGSFTINMNGQDYSLKIPGNYLQKAIAESIKQYGSQKDSSSLDILYQRYQQKK